MEGGRQGDGFHGVRTRRDRKVRRRSERSGSGSHCECYCGRVKASVKGEKSSFSSIPSGSVPRSRPVVEPQSDERCCFLLAGQIVLLSIYRGALVLLPAAAHCCHSVLTDKSPCCP